MTLHLSATGRRLLRRDGVLRLTVTVTIDGVVSEHLKASLRLAGRTRTAARRRR